MCVSFNWIKTNWNFFHKSVQILNVAFSTIMGTESNPKLKLYIRLPVRIEEELQIKELHPDINKVVLPRQKSRRWCVVEFPTVEVLRKAKKEIKKKRINGRKIVVSPYRQGKQGKKKPKQEGKKGKNKEELFFIDTKPLLSLLKKN